MSKGSEDSLGWILFGVGFSTGTLMFLTAAHHVYGARLYDTPWRSHVAGVSVWSTLLIWVGLLVVYLSPIERLERIAFWGTVTAVTVVPVAWIWLFESVYNHLVKVVLYYLAVPKPILDWLFPPSLYHMPDDFIFETTGLLQVLAGLAVVYYTGRFIRARTR